MFDDYIKIEFDDIKSISYTDGTHLIIETYDLMKPPQKLAYKSLLDDAIHQGLTGHFSVLDIK